jgi:hypothetical protein
MRADIGTILKRFLAMDLAGCGGGGLLFADVDQKPVCGMERKWQSATFILPRAIDDINGMLKNTKTNRRGRHEH